MAHKGPFLAHANGGEYCYTCGHPLGENIECSPEALTPKGELIKATATDMLLDVEAWRGHFFREDDGGATMRWLTRKLEEFVRNLEKLP